VLSVTLAKFLTASFCALFSLFCDAQAAQRGVSTFHGKAKRALRRHEAPSQAPHAAAAAHHF